jgi:hypothetical protein
MIRAMTHGEMDRLCDELTAAVEHGRTELVPQLLPRLSAAVERGSADELTRAVARCAGLLGGFGLIGGGEFAVLCGAMVAAGARPERAVGPVLGGLATALEAAESFLELWTIIRPGRPLPRPDDYPALGATFAVVSSHVATEDAAQTITQGWYAAGRWAAGATAMLTSADTTASVPDRTTLLAAAEALLPVRPDLRGLVALLRQDDEPATGPTPVRSALDLLCDELDAALARQDEDAVFSVLELLGSALERGDLDAVARAAVRCAEKIPALGYRLGGRLAVLAGSAVERGAPAEAVAGPVLAGLADTLRLTGPFRAMWAARRPGSRPPDPRAEIALPDAYTAAVEGGLPSGDALALAESWFAVDRFVWAAMAVLCSPDVRRTVPDRADVVAFATELIDVLPDLHWLVEMLRVLEGEQLVVLHRATGRGYRVTISGIGDNRQLHTLLVGALSGPADQGLLDGVDPDPRWVAVAADAPEEQFGGEVTGTFGLIDFAGQIRNHGVPAEIPLVDGVRVIVLDPLVPPLRWPNVRKFPGVPGRLTLDEVLTGEEAAAWLASVAPAGNVTTP